MLQENRTAVSGQDPYVKDTASLIASDKVEGTAVYGRDGDRIGSIQRIILEKRGGRVAYAVLSFGGFWGIGDDYYPLPWEKLTYDESLDGYRIDLTREQLPRAIAPTARTGTATMAGRSMTTMVFRHTGSDRHRHETLIGGPRNAGPFLCVYKEKQERNGRQRNRAAAGETSISPPEPVLKFTALAPDGAHYTESRDGEGHVAETSRENWCRLRDSNT